MLCKVLKLGMKYKPAGMGSGQVIAVNTSKTQSVGRSPELDHVLL
jgi:hypothetical protein